MIIQHNMSALNTTNKLTINKNRLSKSMEKLSSGLRINRAADDAAGLAISEKMRAQIRGLSQAQRNVQDGISLIQTAEGGLSEILDPSLQRMRELAIQAANGVLTDEDRQLIQKEIDQLKQGIDSIANNTEFNSRKLLNGDSYLTLIPPTPQSKFKVTGSISEYTVNDGWIEPSGSVGRVKLNQGQQVIDDESQWMFTKLQFYVNWGPSSFDDGGVIKYNAESLNVFTEGTNPLGLVVALRYPSPTFEYNGLTFDISTVPPSTVSGSQCQFSVVVTPGNNDREITNNQDGRIFLQVGANEGDLFRLNINDMRPVALGISNIDVTTQNSAENAINLIDNAINKVSSERSKMGAYQNTLEHVNNNLANNEVNITASESRIRDLDVAKEMMEYTKINILNQVATSILAQSNQEPQSILQLLK